MDDRNRDIELSVIEKDKLQTAVADAFRSDEDAWSLVSRIDFPARRRPTFTGFHRRAWHEVLIDLDNGVIRVPYRRLLSEALRERPANSVLTRLAARHGVATAGQDPAVKSPDGSAPQTSASGGRHVAFLSYSFADAARVRDLHERLTADGVLCWFDEQHLLPGQDFTREIRKAIRDCRFVVVCLSAASVTRVGFAQRELSYAVDQAKELPGGSIYLVGVRFEPCQLPDSLAHLSCVDIFVPKGYERLLAALRSSS